METLRPQVLQGCLYEQVVADHWVLGDLQTLRRPREEFRNELPTYPRRFSQSIGYSG